ncbi:hypothetical protein GCM10022416_53330 [Actinomadura keratinilytica]|uniref:Uncharacterized protein n=1 Tax=Actinomadura keratinilytica TaxID=547461 RepID=A0ABP7ZCZ0_9ACTN
MAEPAAFGQVDGLLGVAFVEPDAVEAGDHLVEPDGLPAHARLPLTPFTPSRAPGGLRRPDAGAHGPGPGTAIPSSPCFGLVSGG